MTQQHTEHPVQIFRRLVAAKLTGSLLESARAYSDLDTLADHVAIIQEHNGPLRPGRITRAARRRRSAPHEDAEDQGQADRGRREVAGRPATTALAYLARMGAGLGL